LAFPCSVDKARGKKTERGDSVKTYGDRVVVMSSLLLLSS